MQPSSEAWDIRRHTFGAADKLLVDANVWLYIYGPSAPGDWRVRVYSDGLRKMLAARSQIMMDVLVLSEFINRYTRLEYQISFSTYTTFKAFRQSSAFRSVAQAIAASARRIGQLCCRVESGFSTVDLEALLHEDQLQRRDFNDQVLINLCKQNGFTLVTHDGDFRDSGVPLVTANRQLLAQ